MLQNISYLNDIISTVTTKLISSGNIEHHYKYTVLRNTAINRKAKTKLQRNIRRTI